MMSPTCDSPGEISILLAEHRRGSPEAAARLLPLVYEELRKVAAAQMRHERPGHILQPTVLVHEVYLRLFRGAPADWRDRVHFYAVAATVMRHILVDYARKDVALRRGGGATVGIVTEPAAPRMPQSSEELLDLDAALTALAERDSRAARVVELRYLLEMSESEAAEALGIGVSSLKRDWVFARSWLKARLVASCKAPGSQAGNE